MDTWEIYVLTAVSRRDGSIPEKKRQLTNTAESAIFLRLPVPQTVFGVALKTETASGQVESVELRLTELPRKSGWTSIEFIISRRPLPEIGSQLRRPLGIGRAEQNPR